MSDVVPAERATARAQRLLLLRHGEVASHRGDVPVTDQGLAAATEAGRNLGKECSGQLLILSGETRRTRETARAIADGARAAGAVVEGPSVAFALRNPDLYLAGVRVDMVSSASALAEQVPGMTEEAAARIPFFAGFLSAQDRIGWWLRHPDPPGDDAQAVVRRMLAFAGSLADAGRDAPPVTVGVTHSPLLRACARTVLGRDPGEPDWVAGLEVLVQPDRAIQLSWLASTP